MNNNAFSDEIIETLSIDTVIFGFADAELYVLLVKHAQGISRGKWGLPGGWIRYNESVDDAAYRILTAQTSVSNIYLEELKTFGAVHRYPSKRVITVAFYALVRKKSFRLNPGPTESDVQWFNVHQLPDMIYDHNEIFACAFARLKHKVQHEPVGFNLLPRKFTLLQLKEMYEAILEKELDKGNFRRKLINMNLLIPCEEKQTDVAYRAARLYRFDKKVYNQLCDKGFVFEV